MDTQLDDDLEPLRDSGAALLAVTCVCKRFLMSQRLICMQACVICS